MKSLLKLIDFLYVKILLLHFNVRNDYLQLCREFFLTLILAIYCNLKSENKKPIHTTSYCAILQKD